MACAIQSVTACLKGISENRVIKVALFESGLLNRSLRCNGTQFQSAVIAKGAAILTHWRTLAGNDNNFFHSKIIAGEDENGVGALFFCMLSVYVGFPLRARSARACLRWRYGNHALQQGHFHQSLL